MIELLQAAAICLAISVGVIFKWLVTTVNPGYRKTDVGSTLDNSPFVRYSYDLLWVVWLVVNTTDYTTTVGDAVLLGVLAGLSVVGVDMLLCQVAHRVKEVRRQVKEQQSGDEN